MNQLTEALAVIDFAQTIDDHYGMREFLKGWSQGDTSEWPEFVGFLAALTPSAPIAAPGRDDFDSQNPLHWAEMYRDEFTKRMMAEAEVRHLRASLPASAGDVPGEAQSQAARDVLAERRRQVEAEGWTSEHDDAHGKGEIARAAATYAMAGAMQTSYLRDNFLGEWVNYKFSDVRSQWPGSWDWSWFKPSHPRRDLVKAAALILAEIERLDRLPGEAQTQEGGR